MKRIGSILVVGAGQMGQKAYIKNLLELGFEERQIIVVDINPEKLNQVKAQWPAIVCGQDIASVLREDTAVAIIATSTPSHHRVIAQVAEAGIKHIFCEKPLGIDVAAADAIRNTIAKTGAVVYAAFLINFSSVLDVLTKMMHERNLVLVEAHVQWGKNRFGDMRPCSGDLEDETVHGINVVHMLAGINQQVKVIDVSGRLTHMDFVNQSAQEKAHEMDPSFPMMVNSSTFIMESIRTDHGIVTSSVCSSFVMGFQTRNIRCLLAHADNPSNPVAYVSMDFDVRQPNETVMDVLNITDIQTNKVHEPIILTCNKIKVETEAFLEVAVGGKVDERLTTYSMARQAVKFSDAVLRSHEAGGAVINAYGEADLTFVKKTA
jgi:predicted dehydrogenase